MNADGSNQTQLTNFQVYGMLISWSPVSQKFAIHLSEGGDYVMNADGSNLIHLSISIESDIPPVWSPDGKKIVIVSDQDGPRAIYLVNADGSNQTKLTSSSLNEYYYFFTWSPDGTKLVYTTGNRAIFLMNADGSNPTKLTNFDAAITAPSWAP
jgi:TolB protein